MTGQEGDLLGRRDVQHVHAGAMLLGQPHEALRRDHGGFLVAPDGMAAGVAVNALVETGSQARLVLGVERRAAAGLGDDAGQRRLVVDQQIAGRGPHEDLHAGRAFEAFQLRNVVDVLARRTDIEREIAVHAVAGALDLVGQRLRPSSSAAWYWASRTRP